MERHINSLCLVAIRVMGGEGREGGMEGGREGVP